MTDTCSINNPGLLPLQQALSLIDASIDNISGSEVITVNQALDRVLAESVHSAINVPPFRNSSMDGYAYHSRELDAGRPFTLQLAGTSWAGRAYPKKCLQGQCIRVFTGAVIPQGADSVAIQEQVQSNGHEATFPAHCKAEDNIRYPGEDVKKGAELLKPGKKLTAVDLGFLAACGIYQFSVKRKLNIAFFSSGDELTALGKPLQAGQIYDSNRYTLAGLLQDNAFIVTDLGVIADDKKLLTDTLLDSAKCYDVIVTTGGVSVGDADYIKQILDEIGTVHFWKIAMKPGKPLAFGKISGCHFFGLPGNPVSVIATFQQIVAPALRKLSGAQMTKALRVRAQCSNPFRKSAGRQEFQRGILTQQENGEFSVCSAGKQASNILSSISQANCYVVLAQDSHGTEPGEWVDVEPFATSL